MSGCTVYGNTAGYGGGIGNKGILNSCNIYGNSSSSKGGGVYNYNYGKIINSIILGNASSQIGGGIYNYNNSVVSNCTVYANTASKGSGGIHCKKGTVTNCISWNNIIADIMGDGVSFCCFREATSGGGNISNNPMFINTSDDCSTWDFRLQPQSPCIDKGTTSGAPPTDIIGVKRPQGAGVDMGAYESYNTTPTPTQTPIPPIAQRYYVKPTGNDLNTGASWANAFRSLSKSVTIAGRGDEVWVAMGNYQEAETITNPEGVLMLGGFAGTESEYYQQDPMKFPTIIDGNNRKQCIKNFGILNGFYITRGHSESGGGICNYGIVENCIIYENSSLDYGGGIYNFGKVQNCSIYKNTSFNGGGICNNGILGNCKIHENSASNNGGGINNYNGIVYNCLVYSNTVLSYGHGGGIYNNGTVSNSTFFGNIATKSVGGFYNFQGVVTNCIAWNNSTADIIGESVRFCCFREATSGEGNIAIDPIFVNVSGDISTWDLRLLPLSPCIDTGTIESAPLFDILGVVRPQGSCVDMGAYEFSLSASIKEYLMGRYPYAESMDVNGDRKVDVADLVWLILENK